MFVGLFVDLIAVKQALKLFCRQLKLCRLCVDFFLEHDAPAQNACVLYRTKHMIDASPFRFGNVELPVLRGQSELSVDFTADVLDFRCTDVAGVLASADHEAYDSTALIHFSQE